LGPTNVTSPPRAEENSHVSTHPNRRAPLAGRRTGLSQLLTDIHPTVDGYDFSTLDKMLKWRDNQ
jgi:hypothetical protein